MKHSNSGLYAFDPERGSLTREPAGRPDTTLAVVTQRQADAHAIGKSILVAATTEGRALSEAEKRLCAAVETELGLLAREENAARREAERERAQGRGALGGAPAARGARYADLWPNDALSACGFENFGEFLQVLHGGRADDRLRAAAVEGTPSSGGFLVPPAYSAEAFDAALEEEVVRPRARVYGMTSDERKVAGFAADGGASGPYGFVPSWTAEAQPISEKTPLLRSLSLRAKKLAVLMQASNELVADGLGFDVQLGEVLRKALGWSLDSAFFNGTGAGQPMGVLTAGATITVTKEAGQAAGTFRYENALKMYARLLPGSFRRAVWCVSSTVVPQLYQMSLVIGTGGAPAPFFTVGPDGRMALLGLPVVPTEKLPTLGSRGDVALCDFSYYAVGLRKEIVIDRSAHVGFGSDLETFRGLVRADGQPLLSQPYTPASGDTLSPFVVIEAR